MIARFLNSPADADSRHRRLMLAMDVSLSLLTVWCLGFAGAAIWAGVW